MTRAHLEEYLSRFADSKYLRAPADGAPWTAEQKGRIVAGSYE